MHNLRHTFGRRLRGVGITLETRKTLIGQTNGGITAPYSAAESSELLKTAEKSAANTIYSFFDQSKCAFTLKVSDSK